MHIDEKIWRLWREQLAQGLVPTVAMRLEPTVPVDEALRGLHEAVLEVVEAEQPRDDDPWRGEWSWIEADAGVLVTVLECQALDEVLPAVVAALQARGISGALRAYERRAQAPEWPIGPLVEVRLRARGRREHAGGRRPHWRPDPESFERALEGALTWCARGAGMQPWLITGFDPHVAVAPEELSDRVRAVLRDHWTVEVRAGHRGVVVDSVSGRVALTDVGRPWQRALGPLVDAVRAVAGAVAYGFVKVGVLPFGVLHGQSLQIDWPPRPDIDPRALPSGAAFEDEYAPDAFAVQLLGPGYARRIPTTPRYTQESVGDTTLLTHVDLDAWFETPFVAPEAGWQHSHTVTPPPVLAQAREALAPILLREEHLTPAG